ncbi:MAG: hypothetical protein H7Z14_18885 [Anaerolineae bacterium]|nr:hypothetical protein [Phycisphaerae bacterium]
MKSTMFWALIALNALLLVTFLGRFTPGNTAVAAQNNAQNARRPGEYAMIPGEVTGGSAGVVYILDTTNGVMTAATYDQATGGGKLVSQAQINVTEIFARGAAQNQPNAPKGRK